VSALLLCLIEDEIDDLGIMNYAEECHILLMIQGQVSIVRHETYGDRKDRAK
jgi:hypothetical protein